MPLPDLDHIRRTLALHEPETTPPGDGRRRAAVAMVLAGRHDDLVLCFIRRAEHEDDPWSGHMAFPGGRAERRESPQVAAERETREEVGLILGRDHRLGALSDLPVRIAGRDVDLVLSSFVYYLGVHPARLQPEPREVAEAYWIPLSHLWNVDHGTHLDLERGGHRMIYPGIRFRDHVIWGLTFRLLGLFSDVLEHPLPHLEEIPGLGR